MDVLAFQRKWIDASRQKERSAYVTHFTNFYNARPTWLANAHAALDRAVWDAYGWPAEEVPADAAEDAILSRLLALNGERADATRSASRVATAPPATNDRAEATATNT
jgi:hypothetical protein